MPKRDFKLQAGFLKRIYTFLRMNGCKLTEPGVSVYEITCIELEKHGMPCPADYSYKRWVFHQLDFIYSYVGANLESDKAKVKKKKNSQKPDKDIEKHGPVVLVDPKKYELEQKVGKKPAYAKSDAFLKSYEWRKVRMQAIKRYGAKCMCCGATPATGAAMNVDHIKPRKHYPQLALDLENLQILCGPCNHGKGNWDETDWRPKLVNT